MAPKPARCAELEQSLDAHVVEGSASRVHSMQRAGVADAQRRATGTIDGLTNATTREQIALAAHDGVLRGLLDGVDALRRVGATVDGRTFLVGGGSRSAAYRQRAADLSGGPVIVPDTDETMPFVPEAVRLIRERLDPAVALIGYYLLKWLAIAGIFHAVGRRVG